MAEILGIGATHYPPGLVPEEYKPWPLARMLHSDAEHFNRYELIEGVATRTVDTRS